LAVFINEGRGEGAGSYTENKRTLYNAAKRIVPKGEALVNSVLERGRKGRVGKDLLQ
jgi:hypothetical protein